MSLLDLITGGKSSDASADMEQAVAALKAVGVPKPEDLTLPQLEQYVQQGVLTPAMMQAFTVGKNALDSTSAANSGLDTENEAIGGLRDIISKGGSDATEKADIQKVLNTLGTTQSGANDAALADAARHGTAGSGLTLAKILANNGQAAATANTGALEAARTASERNLGAITGAGQLGSNVQGQEYTSDMNKANAANAIAQFNASQQQNAGGVNAAAKNTAAESNLANKQAISNANVQGKQTQQESETQARQTAYEDALQRASAISNAYTNKAGNDTTQGQQQAGVIGGLISGAGQVAAGGMKPPTPATAAHGGVVCMDEGGNVPGNPQHPGVDTTADDHVPAMLSPHEIVVPKTIAERRDPAEIMNFVRSLPRPEKPAIHPKAALDLLRALDLHHKGA